jgi:hypothetical protein
MNTKEIAKAYGMPSRVAALIAKDPSQFKYWQKCGEEAYNGCLKWVDSRDCCAVCLLCQRCCRSWSLHAEIDARKNEPEPLAIPKPAAKAVLKAKEALPEATNPEEEAMPIVGRMEIMIKINDFPTEVKTVSNGWKEFVVDVSGREITITVKPKVFAKFQQAQDSFPSWVATITGKMGKSTKNGFILDEPGVQVFEKKPKEPKQQQEPQEQSVESATV